MANLTAERLRELYSLDEQAGVFVRRFARNGSPAGRRIERVNSGGYVAVAADGREYKAHRLVWLYVHGQWPDGDIDHIDGCRNNNRLSNLRLATDTLNKANEKLRSDNTSGFKGAKPHPNGKWQARIGIGGKRLSLGYHATAAEAHAAYMRAAKLHFGEFARSS
jgi:hypothetical protein